MQLEAALKQTVADNGAIQRSSCQKQAPANIVANIWSTDNKVDIWNQ